MRTAPIDHPMTWNRRSFLGAALGMPFLNMARASTPGRVAVVDWAMLETLVAIDVVPVAAPELIQFRKIAHEPPIPQQVADLGLRGSPNYEMLRLSQPDLIVSSPWFAWAERNLSRIAPVVSHSIYEPGRLPYAPAEQVTIALGDRLGRTRQARAYIDAASQDIEEARYQLAGKVAGPFFLINLGDARHFRVFGSDSMFGDVLQRLGLENAWTRPTSYAAAAPIPLETLADVPDATIIVISPIPPDAQATLTRSTLWNALPAVRGNRVTILKPINPFGALPAARRFTRLLTEALLASRVHAHG